MGQKHRGNRKSHADTILWQLGKGKRLLITQGISTNKLKIEVIGEIVVLVERWVVGKERFLVDYFCYVCLGSKMGHLIKSGTWSGDKSCFNEHGKMQYNPLGRERFVPYFADSLLVISGVPISF